MLTRVFLLILVAGVTVAAQTSQPPDPASQPQRQAGDTEQPAAANPQQSTPTPVVVNVYPAPQAGGETSEEQAEVYQKTTDRWYARTSTVVTGVTGLLGLIVIGMQVYIAKVQKGISAKQSEIMREQFAVTTAPRIIVSEIEMLPALDFLKLAAGAGFRDALESIFAAPDELSGSFRITNIGDSTAKMRLLEAVIYIGPRLPMKNPAHETAQLPVASSIERGLTTRVDLRPFQLDAPQQTAIAQEHAHIFVVGKVIYDDPTGKSRRTGFARKFDLNSGRFEAIGNDPDYEYTD